ncbi:hypothetical protein Tco_1354164 [Tanacetum coccineum]
MEDEIFFNQSKYIKEMLKKFGLEDSKPTKTPMSTEIKLTKDDEADFVDSSKYRENPKTAHLEAIKRIFRYIRGTSHLGLWYLKGTGIETIVYVDSDHASNYVDRKSTSGVCTFMECCLKSWFAKKQTALAISTTKAEYVFAGKACQQALWMKQAIIDYGIRLDDVPIMYDNKGEITTYTNQMDYKRTKEYLPRVHRTRQMDEELRESYRALEKCIFHEARIVTPSFIVENNMLLFFQVVGLEPFLTLNEPICPRFVVEFYHSLKVKRDKEERPYIEFKLVKNKQDGPMPFAMLLIRLYNHILQTNPQAIIPPARFTFHEHVMDPLDISRNPSKEKGKKIASPSVTSSSSSLSNGNEAPSFLEFYDELSDSEDLTKAQ